MTQDIEQAIRKLAQAFEEHSIPYERLFVFGSAARGTQHEWSDIDVGVVGPAFKNDRIEESVTMRRVAYDIDPSLAPIPLRPEDLENRFNTIGVAIKREGREVKI